MPVIAQLCRAIHHQCGHSRTSVTQWRLLVILPGNFAPSLLLPCCDHHYSHAGRAQRGNPTLLANTSTYRQVKPNISTAVFSAEPGVSLDRGGGGGNVLVAAVNAHRNLQEGRPDVTTLRKIRCLPAPNKHKHATTDHFLAYNSCD